MPRYDFTCGECREVFEVNAAISEYTAMLRERRIACPACGSCKVVRLFTPPGVLSGKTSASHGGTCCPGGDCR